MATRTKNAAPPKLNGGAAVEDKDEDGAVVIDDAQLDEQQQLDEPTDGGATEESVETLRAQLEEQRQRADAAERRATEASTNTQRVADDLETAQARVIQSAIEKEELTKKEAAAAYRAARESGDYDAETTAMDNLQQANINLKALNSGKNELERQIEDKKNVPTDPLERYSANLNPKAKAWVKSHFSSADIDSSAADLETAHFKALGNKLAVNSTAYFDFIEEELGFKEKPQVQQRQEPAPQRRQAAPAAPPSRTNAGNSSNLPAGVTMTGNGKYRLSERHRDAARTSGISDTEYLNELLKLQAAGELGRTTH